MGPTGSVKIELEVPIELWDALTWYVKLTDYKIYTETSACKKFIIDSLKNVLQSESDSGVPEATKQITKELKEWLGLIL